MTVQLTPASHTERADFLNTVIEAAEKRRDAAESKASIIIATNAILLTAMGSLGLPTPVGNNPVAWPWYRLALFVITLGGIAASSLFAIQVLAPVISTKRKQIMNLPGKEFNVFFAGKIAEYENSKAYLADIETLTEQQMIEQLSAQAYNLSRLVMDRYNWFHWSQRALIFSVFTFIILAATGLV